MNLFKSRELSIVIDEHSVRFLEVTTKKGKVVKFHNLITINECVIGDGALDKAKWKGILKTTLKENKIKARNIHVIIPSSLVIVRQQMMPNLPEKDLKQMVNFEIGNTIHLPFDMPVVDIVKLDSEPTKDSDQGEDLCKVAIVAASGNLIYPLVKSLKENKLRPKTIDIPALSLYRLFNKRYPEIKNEPILLGHITRFGIDLHILDKGILGFTRHIPIEMGNFIQHDLNEEEFDKEIIYKEIKKQENYQSFVGSLGHEIERAIDFFQYTLNNRDKKIVGCYLLSNIHFPEGFYTYLQERVSIEVQSLVCQYKPDEQTEDVNYKGFEIGLGMFLRKAVGK